MDKNSYVHLYVEKYIRSENELFIDFIQEDEFLRFRNRGEYNNDMHLDIEHYEPTMLLFHNCSPSLKIREGDIISISMKKLQQIREEFGDEPSQMDRENQNTPATVFLEFYDSSRYMKLIDVNDYTITQYISKKFIHSIGFSWDGSPCALDGLEENYQLRIWNVGEGSANSISNANMITIFDIGASIYYSTKRLTEVFRNHVSLSKSECKTSLIISHWHADHYRLLLAADDEFLKGLCYIFCPSDIITLTAKQVAARIEKFCKNRVSIVPPECMRFRKCGIKAVFKNQRYTLYTGERSSNQNYSGLMLKLESKSCIALLCADHSNYQVWEQELLDDSDLKKQLLYIVVPHHGGKRGKVMLPKNEYNKKTAIISVGSNGYGHPNTETLCEYQRAQFQVIRTDLCNEDVLIDMK